MAHGLEVVLEAADHLRRLGRNDVLFRIVGDGAERERLQREATIKGLDNVQFLGMLPKEQIPETITGSDACLVHLRATELFGTVIPSKIFEIMAMNVPIIMGVRGQAQQIVLDAEAGVTMTPEDPMSLLAAMDRVAADPGRFRHGREYVGRHFNRDLLAERMLTVFAEVAGEPLPLSTAVPSDVTDLRKAA
jgi:glycosyltransferase involved in cell wall biosynthesis